MRSGAGLRFNYAAHLPHLPLLPPNPPSTEFNVSGMLCCERGVGPRIGVRGRLCLVNGFVSTWVRLIECSIGTWWGVKGVGCSFIVDRRLPEPAKLQAASRPRTTALYDLAIVSGASSFVGG